MKTPLKHTVVRAIAAIVCMTGFAHASITTQTISLAGVLAGNSSTGDVFELAQSFNDAASGTTVNYNLVVAMDWIDGSGASVTGLTGNVFGNPSGLGANTTSGISPGDSGAVEAVSLASGGTALERLTFSVSGLTSGVVFTGFSNPTGNLNDEIFDGTTTFSITPGADGFRVSGIDATFDVPANAVPEPGTWMMFGVLGILMVRRAFRTRD